MQLPILCKETVGLLRKKRGKKWRNVFRTEYTGLQEPRMERPKPRKGEETDRLRI